MKIAFSHCTVISSNIQPFEELSNFQSLNSSILSSGNHCCYTSLPLKMTNSWRCRPLTEIYSMIIVHSYRPGFFLKVLHFSTMPNTRPLVPIPCIRPVSSIFHRSTYMTFLIAGRLKNGNHAYIASVVAPLTWAASIRRVWKVITRGLQRKKLSNQCFPMPVAEPSVRRIRLENIRICACVGAKPRISWI